jgi:UDP-2-acetamido-3-amino-2,3-dideoxy-glucuronate N-acetyltransferase
VFYSSLVTIYDSRVSDLCSLISDLKISDLCFYQQPTINNQQSTTNNQQPTMNDQHFFKHESAYVDEGAEIGAGTKIWHFCHIMKGAIIGERCVFGQNVNVDAGVIIGSNVKVQNNVSIYGGMVIEDDVFLGPSCVLTNVTNPRSQISRHSLYEKTLIRRGATIGANATIVCGITLGRYCFIAAGAVVAKDVPDYALMMGTPARQAGWMSRHGHILRPQLTADNQQSTILICPESGLRYELVSGTGGQKSEVGSQEPASPISDLRPQTSDSLPSSPVTIYDSRASNDLRPRTSDLRSPTSGFTLYCLDLDEEAPLPPEQAVGKVFYDDMKKK